MRHMIALLVLLACISGPVAFATEPGAVGEGAIQTFQYKSALEASQGAIGRQLSDYPLTDAAGRALRLSDLKGRPLVLSMIYTSCYQICPMTVRHLSKVIDKARDTLGEDNFSVAILGFDTQFDSPLAMQQFAKKQGIDDKGWHLLSADADTVSALAKELGFVFFASPNGFDHIVQATVIDGEGTVYRQVYGEVFDTPLLVDPLMQLVLGRPQPEQTLLADLLNKVRFFCTNYDPASDSYHFDYSLFVGMVIGGMIILATAAFIVREYLHGRRQSRV